MSYATHDEVVERLQALPDMQPPADAWQRIRTRLARDDRRMSRHLIWSASAVAVAATLAAVFFLGGPLRQIDSVPVEGLSVHHEAEALSHDSAVRALQRRSRYIEQMLQGLPPRARIVQADTEGAIGELEDRIAAIDDELNRAELQQATPRGRAFPRGPSSTRMDSPYEMMNMNVGLQDSRVLWQRRVDLMDHLLEVRYSEAGAASF